MFKKILILNLMVWKKTFIVCVMKICFLTETRKEKPDIYKTYKEMGDRQDWELTTIMARKKRGQTQKTGSIYGVNTWKGIIISWALVSYYTGLWKLDVNNFSLPLSLLPICYHLSWTAVFYWASGWLIA
jgi:hypothetical protein